MSHEQVVLVVIGTFAVGLAVAVAVNVWMARMFRESQRLTRAVAGLVVQESEKIQTLFRDSERS